MADSGTPAHSAMRLAANAVFMPRFSMASSRCSPLPLASNASTSSTRKSSGTLRMRADSTASPWARGKAVMRSRPDQQAHGVRSDALAAAGEAQGLGGGRLDAHRIGFDAEVFSQHPPHRLRVRADFRPLADYGDVGIAQAPAAFAQQRVAMAQEGAAVGAFPSRIGRREVAPDVAQRERAEHRVAQRMDHNVAIGMRQHALRMRHAHATKHDVVARAEGMHVEAVADAEVGNGGAHRRVRMEANRATTDGVET